MSKYLIFNFLLVLFIVNCPISVSVSKDLTKNDPPKYNPTSTIFSKPSTGISFADQDINFKNIKFRLTITRVNLKKRSVRIVSSHSLALKNDSNSHLGGYNLSEYQKLTNSPLVLSGGYLSSWQPALPLGLVKVNGVQANRPHLSWLVDGLFCTNGKEVIIDKYSSIEQTRNWLDCLQAGPLLIKDGKIIIAVNDKNEKLLRSKQEQAFIGYDDHNHCFLGVTSKMTLLNIIDFLRSSHENGGLGCTNAIRLSGHVTAGLILILPDGKVIEGGNKKVLLPNAIFVK